MIKTRLLVEKMSFLALIFCLFSIHSVFADTNGIWTKAEDIVAGSFGSDEGGGIYQFPSNIVVSNEVISSGINTTNLDVANFAQISRLNVTNDIIVDNIYSSGVIRANELESATNITAERFCIGSVCRNDWSTIWQQGTFGNRIYYNSGPVGMGTTYPYYSLDVDASSGLSDYYTIRADGGRYGIYGSGSIAGAYFRDSDGSSYTRISYGTLGIDTSGDIRTSEDIITGGDIRTNGMLCLSGVCTDGFQAIAKSTSSTSTSYSWTRVYSNYISGDGKVWEYNNYVSLDNNKPILGIRMSGYTDDGGICTATIPGYFSSYVTHRAYVRNLPLNGVLDGYAREPGKGDFPTTTFIFEDLPSGVNIGPEIPSTGSGYNKPLGLSYIPAGKSLSVDQYSYGGPGGENNQCTIDVLYGEYE